MIRLGGVLLLVGGVVALSPVADAQLERAGTSEVSYTAFGPAGLTIVGKTSDLAVTDGENSIVVTVPLATLTTGIGVRDRHMREDLETAKYPTAELTVSRSDLKIPDAGRQIAADSEGMLKLHGQSHPIRFHYSAKHQGNAYEIRSELQLKMADWGIVVPPYLGMNVKPDVNVSARFGLTEK